MAGIPNSFIYSKNQRSRELISYSAVITLVIRYQGTENKADELRKFLLKPLLLPPALLQQSSTCTTSTTSPTVVLSTLNESPSTPARNCQPPTLASHSPAVTRNLSAVLSPLPNVLSSTCPSTLVGGLWWPRVAIGKLLRFYQFPHQSFQFSIISIVVFILNFPKKKQR